MLRRIKRFLHKGGEKPMGLYTIILIYEVPAPTIYQATDELAQARELHAEKVFHVKTIVREAGVKPWRDKPIALKQPAKWGTIFKRQLTGKW
jgi:hypothetical protein